MHIIHNCIIITLTKLIFKFIYSLVQPTNLQLTTVLTLLIRGPDVLLMLLVNDGSSWVSPNRGECATVFKGVTALGSNR